MSNTINLQAKLAYAARFAKKAQAGEFKPGIPYRRAKCGAFQVESPGNYVVIEKANALTNPTSWNAVLYNETSGMVQFVRVDVARNASNNGASVEHIIETMFE